eukprot:351874-Chlamydomonas_euryale.AAC.7
MAKATQGTYKFDLRATALVPPKNPPVFCRHRRNLKGEGLGKATRETLLHAGPPGTSKANTAEYAVRKADDGRNPVRVSSPVSTRAKMTDGQDSRRHAYLHLSRRCSSVKMPLQRGKQKGEWPVSSIPCWYTIQQWGHPALGVRQGHKFQEPSSRQHTLHKASPDDAAPCASAATSGLPVGP